MRRRLSFAAALLSLAAPVALAADIPENFVVWRPGLASSAQPTREWLANVKRNYDVLVNLAPPQVQGSLADEGGIVASKGVVYVNIPVNFGAPTAEDFRMFSEVMKAAAGRSVFVHCQANFRGSSFVLLYRVIHEDADLSQTLAKLNGVWVPDPVWKKFIESTLAAAGKKADIF